MEFINELYLLLSRLLAEIALVDIGTAGIIIATFTGPVAAVIVTRRIDKLRDKEKRRLDIFRALMRTRNLPLNAEHVGALNLVEIEFHNREKVITALKALLNHFNSGYAGKTVEEITAANTRSDELRTNLLSAMAGTLGYKFEERGYLPTGWGIELDEQAAARHGLAELLSGRRTLPVTILPVPANPVGGANEQQPVSPFPPKPQ